MQQRGTVTMENVEEIENSLNTPPSSRSRHNSKLKVLVRSHAMREESPPRESPSSPRTNLSSSNNSGIAESGSGTLQMAVLLSPKLQISVEDETLPPTREFVSPTNCSPGMMTSSPLAPMSPVAVVLSPSVSSSLIPSASVSTIFTATPKSLSPTILMHPQTFVSHSQVDQYSLTAFSQIGENGGSTESLQADEEHELRKQMSPNKHILDKSCHYRNSSTSSQTTPNSNQTDIVVVNLKQTSHNNFRKNKYGTTFCDCQQNHLQNCLKCTKNSERNVAVNNNNFSNINNNMSGGNNPNMLSVSRTSSRGKLRQQSSSLGSFESSSNSPCLSRDSSSEQYTDTTGVDLEQFIPETLNRNAKDRALMLRIEQELVNLAKDKTKMHYKFPPMSSYQRMLVHRCAAYFGMDHNIEPTGKSVVVNKTKNTRIPDVEFKEHIKDDIIFSEEPRRSILKRDSNSIEDYSFKSPDRSFGLENRRSKSFEEREEEYEKVRRRIFNRELHDGSSEDFAWSEVPWSSTESDYSSRFRLQPPNFHPRQFGKLIKVHSEDPGETHRPCVAKSYSFGGYGGAIHVLSRGDSMMSTHSAGPRLLTKQDSGASSVSWRLSPSSSGYKSQSQMSESVTPSPTSTPHLVGASGDTNEIIMGDDQGNRNQGMMDESTAGSCETHIVWAVTDIQNVPKGSVIIDPHTGQPLKNEDGSTYQFDPNNPPPNTVQLTSKPPLSPQKYKAPPSSSPKKSSRPSRSSPTPRRSNMMINSSTSPSLPPLSPPEAPPMAGSPVHHHSHPSVVVAGAQKRFTPGCMAQTDNCSAATTVAVSQQPYPGYTGGATYGGATPTGGDSTGVYQQPYYVYTSPYSTMHIQQQYEGRMEAPPMQEMANTAFYISDSNTGPAPGQSAALAYHQTQPTQSYWNQPIAFYQSSPQPGTPTPPHQRYQPTQTQSGFVPSGYTANYLAAAAPPPPSHQPPHNHELVPVYPNQPLQVVYHQNQSAPQNPIIYHNQPLPVVYAPHNTVYASPGPASAAYPPPQMTPQHMAAQSMPPYPQSTPTPNSCSSSTSSHVFPGPPLQEPQSFMHLPQSLQSLSLTSGLPTQGMLGGKVPQPFDYRPRTSGSNGYKNSNNNKFGNNKNMMGSSQSSTGTNSPAATVIAAGFCPTTGVGQNPSGIYRTPPETPPAQFVYPPNFAMPPLMYKQVGNVRAATPVTARSSRSPTPAGDLPHFDKQRMPLPPNLYQGMPYVVPADPRFVPGRHQSMYRQPAHMNKPPIYGQGSENRSHKNRKPKTNKQGGLPPSGK